MRIKNFEVSISELDNDMIAINFDKDGKAGGYVSLKLYGDGVCVDVFNGDGDVVQSAYAEWEELEPQTEVSVM